MQMFWAFFILALLNQMGVTYGMGMGMMQQLLHWRDGYHTQGNRRVQSGQRVRSKAQSADGESDLPPALASQFWVKILEDYGPELYNYVPATRRAASADIYNFIQNKEVPASNRTDDTAVNVTNVTEHEFNNETTKQSVETSEEYMIISGGYTDRDWKQFPTYAFPITSSIQTTSGQWIDLTPIPSDLDEDSTCQDDDNIAAKEKLYLEATFTDAVDMEEDPWANAQSCSPSGRMGHSSVVYKDYLYVFGGLIYDDELKSSGSIRQESYRLEDVPYIYRLNLKEMLVARQTSKEPSKGWQRIIPRVKPVDASSSAADVLLNHVNRGEGKGGLWSSSSSGENDKFVIYGGMRISKVEYDNSPSKFVNGDTVFGIGSSQNQFQTHKIVEMPIGDVWAYDLVENAWEMLTDAYGEGVRVQNQTKLENGDQMNRTIEEVFDAASDNDWIDDFPNTVQEALGLKDDDWSDTIYFPRSRTAHAATLVGNDLVIHGGMGRDEKSTLHTKWEPLDDMWIFDLSKLQWKRRWVSPPLVRAYHSLVGWNSNGRTNNTSGPVVAAYGGYTTAIDVFSGEEVDYVFDDLLVSYPPSIPDDYSVSLWHKANMEEVTDLSKLIFNRYEHCAVLSKEGTMVVWGGSFESTARTHGLWMINIAGKNSTVKLDVAERDEIVDYDTTITALHTIVILLMFMSMSLTLLLGMTQRYQELLHQANDDADMTGVGFAVQMPTTQSRRRGLHPEIIGTLPEKIYSSSETVHDSNGADSGNENECCPICLVQYEEGDKLRVLPCGHFMHQSCVDAWLQNNPSCPSCRYSLSELVDDRPMLQLRTLRSHLSARSTSVAQFIMSRDEMFHLGELNDLEMTPYAGGPRIIDLSSLALEEDDNTANAPDRRDSEPTAMQELSEWRRRRRMLRANRLGGFSLRRMREHRGRTVLPQTEQPSVV